MIYSIDGLKINYREADFGVIPEVYSEEMEEKAILISTPDSILNRIDRITLEYHTMQDGEYIKNLLINKGFSVEPHTLSNVERSVLYARK